MSNRSKKSDSNHPAKFNKKQGAYLQALSSYSGPIPHPDILAHYDEIYQGAAKIIIDRAEKQLDHRVDMEKSVVKSNILNEKLGIISAFLIALAFGYIAYRCAIAGHDWPASIIGKTDVVGLVATFINGGGRNIKELSQKRNAE
ncbi:hypothetical protein DRQ36_00575 [bacterium]|nr:MAG: hypothetical protein DRQ36_00575 [bacterium]